MKSFDLGKLLILAAAAASLLAPGVARAGGIFAGEAGSQAQSRGGAFTAKADDPTALMHNPAGLMKTGHWSIFAGANIVHFSQTFDRDGVYQLWPGAGDNQPAFAGQEMPQISNSGNVQPIPMLVGAGRFGRFAVALGLFAPQAYPNREYPETVDVNGMVAPSPGRYDIVKQESLAALPSLAVAYRITDKLDVGLRASWGFSTLKATSRLWALPNHVEDPEVDATFNLDVKDTFVPAFGVGLLFRPMDDFEIGANYNSEMDLDMTGTGSTTLGSRAGGPGLSVPTVGPVPDDQAACAPGGTPDALKACVNIVIPQTATLAVRHIWHDGMGREKADVELDVRWENWSAAKDIHVIVDAMLTSAPFSYLNETVLYHGFQDVISTRLGGSYALGLGKERLVLRAGAGYDTPTAPDSWARLDIDSSARVQLGAGASYDAGSWRIDLGGAAIISPDRTVTGPDPFTPPADQPVQADRTQPDPTNPKNSPVNQELHPINEGKWSSGYLVVATGVTFLF